MKLFSIRRAAVQKNLASATGAPAISTPAASLARIGDRSNPRTPRRLDQGALCRREKMPPKK
jgi:hypothetical protein